MGFTYIAEILENSQRRFKLEEKQFAIKATLVLLWKHWDYGISIFEKEKDVEGLYVLTLQRDIATDILLKAEVGLFGRT
jgi:hypothetical protein